MSTLSSQATTIPRGASDQELVARLKAGEDAAYRELVREFAPRLMAVARRMLSNEADASDALQRAFLSCFKSVGNFEGKSSFSTWIHRVLMNECLMLLRKKKRLGETSIDAMLPTFAPEGHQQRVSAAWGETAETVLERQEAQVLVRKAIGELPEPFKVVLLMRDIELMEIETIAELLELTPNAVRIRLHRARQALREVLAPRFERGEV